ncbi:transcription factor Dp-1-like [Pollicipes pollicipes]|nr:transcription factor Dp-1-like [Pollicipes pollicipes]
MGLALGLENGTCREEDVEKAKAMVPPSLAPYIDQLARDGSQSERLSVDLETALSTRGLGSGTSTTSERGDSVTPSIDFDTDDDEEEDDEDDDDEEEH